MRSFFQRKGVPSTLTIREKYHTEQATAYRKIIKSKVENTTVPSEDDIPQYVAPKKSTNKERGDYVGMSREKQRSAEAAARERMRNKFKNGMRGVGSNGGGSSSQHNRGNGRGQGDWIENSGAALQQTLGMAFEAASRQTSKLRQRDWSKDRHAVKSEVSKGVSWLSTGVSTLWKSAKRAISDDNEPVRFYRDTNDRPRSSGFGKGISSDDSSVVRKKTTLVEQRERRRSRSHSPKKNASNDWDNDDWGDDDDEFEDNQVKKKIVASSSSSTNEQHSRLPTSEFDPFDLEKDFLGEIDAVLNDESDEDVPSSSRTKNSEPVSLPKPTSTTRKTTTTTTKQKAPAKPKTVSGDDFFSCFGV